MIHHSHINLNFLLAEHSKIININFLKNLLVGKICAITMKIIYKINKLQYKKQEFTMKKYLLLVVLFCFLAANTVFAQSKIAIIDVQAITFQSKAGQKSIEELKVLEQSALKKLEAKRAEVKKLADSINNQKASLSPSALQDKNLELNKQSVELERLEKDLQTEFQTAQAKKWDGILKEVEPVINDYAKEKGYDLVFIVQPGILAYANPAVDITKDIISRFDIKWSKKGTK